MRLSQAAEVAPGQVTMAAGFNGYFNSDLRFSQVP